MLQGEKERKRVFDFQQHEAIEMWVNVLYYKLQSRNERPGISFIDSNVKPLLTASKERVSRECLQMDEYLLNTANANRHCMVTQIRKVIKHSNKKKTTFGFSNMTS